MKESNHSRPLRTWSATYVAGILFIAISTGCEEDTTSPPDDGGPVWKEVALPEAVPDAALSALAFHGDRGIAVGTEYPYNGLVLETTGGTWSLLSTEIDGAALMGVTFTLEGDAVAVGGTLSRHPLVLDERESWAPDEVLESTAFLQSVATTSDGVIHAAGYGVALRSEAAGTWTTETVNYPVGTQDRGILDLVSGPDGALFACAFDDAGDGSPEEPNRMILQNEDSKWDVFAAIPSEANASVLAHHEDLGFLAAGERYGPGSPEPRTVLWRRDDAGNWSEIELPDATGYEAEDVLVASDGKLYLLGSGFADGSIGSESIRNGALWRLDGTRAQRIATWSQRGPQSLGDDGESLYVLGVDYRSGSIRPWLVQSPIN